MNYVLYSTMKAPVLDYVMNYCETFPMALKLLSTVTSTFGLQWSAPLIIISSMVYACYYIITSYTAAKM